MIIVNECIQKKLMIAREPKFRKKNREKNSVTFFLILFVTMMNTMPR